MTRTAADFYEELSSPTDREGESAARAEARRIIKLWMQAGDTKDLDLMRSLMAPGIVIELPFNESGKTEEGAFRRYEGIEACCGFWQVAFEHEATSEGPLDAELTQSADGRVAFVECRGSVVMTTGKPYKNRYVMRVVIDGGKVAHVREYYNAVTSGVAFGRPIAGRHQIESL
jgi:ketosteroid isomerase-like protein